MFEYHGNRLTVDADGVSVEVELAGPIDIEKPLVDIDLTGAKVIYAEQGIVGELTCFDAPEEFGVNGYEPYYSGSSEGEREGYAGEEVLARAAPYLDLGFIGLLAFCQDESLKLKQWPDPRKH